MAARRARDYYEVLGVPRNADERTIKQAYRKLARQYHPDVTGDDEDATARFREVTIAYETLSDPKRRRTYDLFGAADDKGAPSSPIDDALASLRSIFKRDDNTPRPGTDVEVELQVAFVEAYTGAKKDVRVVVDRPCARCAGSGRVGDERCKACRGQGAKLTDETLSVRVPAGVADKTRLRLKGRGPVGEKKGPAGDLYVVVHIAADRRFDRDGDTLFAEVSVRASVALLGGTAVVELPDGPVTMTIPAGTQGGQVFRLREKGFASLAKGPRGDALVTVHIALPARLSDDARARVAELATLVPGF